jgi:hypothetical protein
VAEAEWAYRWVAYDSVNGVNFWSEQVFQAWEPQQVDWYSSRVNDHDATQVWEVQAVKRGPDPGERLPHDPRMRRWSKVQAVDVAREGANVNSMRSTAQKPVVPHRNHWN